MTILQFPLTLAEMALRHAGYIVFLPPPEPDTDLRPNEADILALLGDRLPRTTKAIAADSPYALPTVKCLLTVLHRKGLIVRVGHYHHGGWLKTPQAAQTAA